MSERHLYEFVAIFEVISNASSSILNCNFFWRIWPKNCSFFENAIPDFQTVVSIACRLFFPPLDESPDVVRQHGLLRRSLGVNNLTSGFGIARQTGKRDTAVDIDQIGVGAEEVQIGWAPASQVVCGSVVVLNACFADELLEGCAWRIRLQLEDASRDCAD